MQDLMTDGQPDRDKVQKTLQEKFELSLLFRHPEEPPDSIVEKFARDHSGVLAWLGEQRQDEMLKQAQGSCNVDLSKWLS